MVMRYLRGASEVKLSVPNFWSEGAVELWNKIMNTKLFVGNLSFKVTEAELEELFTQAGAVVSVAIPTDRETGRKRGFAFVEMQTQAEAEAAVKQFNGQTIDGRQIAVNPSQPREGGQKRNNKRW